MSLEVNIKKNFGRFVLDVNFTAESGVLGLLGASGCGKSMTLRCIAGIVTPDEGRIVLDGVTLFDSAEKINLPPQERKVGLMFQNYALFPNMTVMQNIMCGLKNEKDKNLKRQKAEEIIKKVRLEGLEKRRPHQLSGGQQQRVALARILVGNPKIIMLDEPFSALDSFLRWEVEMELLDILEDFEGPVLMVSHSREEVYRICSHICVIDNGKNEKIVTTHELFDTPATLDAALLSGCQNFSRARKLGEREVEATDWSCRLKTAGRVPDDIAYIGVKSDRLSLGHEENDVGVTVTRIVDDITGTIVMLSTGTKRNDLKFSQLRLDISKENVVQLEEGEYIEVGISPENILLLR